MRTKTRLPVTLVSVTVLVLGACQRDREKDTSVALTGADSVLDHTQFNPVNTTGALLSNAPAIGQPTEVELAGGYLWVADATGDPALHVIDPNTGALIRSIGRKGRGPGEFVNIMSISKKPGDDSTLWAFDPDQQRFTALRLNRDSTTSVVQTMTLRPESQMMRAIWVSPIQMSGVAWSDSAHFQIFDKSGNFKDAVRGSLLGDSSITTDERLRASAAGFRICNASDRDGFIYVYFSAGRVEYYDKDSKLIWRARVPYPSNGEFKKDSVTHAMTAISPRQMYSDCATTKRYLYALFTGRSSKAFSSNDRSSGEFVHVFNWDGSLAMVFKLDHAIHGFTVSPDDGELYGAAPQDPAIYRFPLKRQGAQ